VIEQADWRALGTGVRLMVLDGGLSAARAAVERVLDDVDRTYSRFRSDSELMSIRASAGRAVRVSPLLARAIAGAMDAARRSNGAVDPTVGRAMRVIGYDLDFDLIAGSARPLELRIAPVPGWSAISFDSQSRELRVPRGVELDLGSTGKGLAADMAAAAALSAAGTHAGVLVSLGGDMAVAGTAPDGGWRILVTEDSRTPSDGDGELIAIHGGAIATSSTTVRRWRSSEGISVHHIVDPRTGLAADTPWRTATVVAATCELANGASTAAIVMGEDAPAWLEASGLPARLVATDGRVLRLGGWPEPDPDGEPATHSHGEPARPDTGAATGAAELDRDREASRAS
jgi:thiamine biosynthesis lipoprotein